VAQSVRLIPVEQIVFLRSDEKYTLVVWEGGEALIRTPIRELAEELDPGTFAQIHRSVIVNLRQVAQVDRGFNDTAEVRLRTGARCCRSAAATCTSSGRCEPGDEGGEAARASRLLDARRLARAGLDRDRQRFALAGDDDHRQRHDARAVGGALRRDRHLRQRHDLGRRGAPSAVIVTCGITTTGVLARASVAGVEHLRPDRGRAAGQKAEGQDSG
jgi:hypothetical protein